MFPSTRLRGPICRNLWAGVKHLLLQDPAGVGVLQCPGEFPDKIHYPLALQQVMPRGQ